MRCVVDDETMAMGTLLWVRDLSESEQVMWCTAMARALIRLPDDRSEYNHAGAQFVAARAFEQRSLAAQVEAEIGHAAWVRNGLALQPLLSCPPTASYRAPGLNPRLLVCAELVPDSGYSSSQGAEMRPGLTSHRRQCLSLALRAWRD